MSGPGPAHPTFRPASSMAQGCHSLPRARRAAWFLPAWLTGTRRTVGWVGAGSPRRRLHHRGPRCDGCLLWGSTKRSKTVSRQPFLKVDSAAPSSALSAEERKQVRDQAGRSSAIFITHSVSIIVILAWSLVRFPSLFGATVP